MFPKDFKFGFSQAGFQSEMGITEKDTNSDWYYWANDPFNINHHIVSGDNPADGAGYWDLYKTDHRIAQSLNMNAARIGIEWSRIFPTSTEKIEVNSIIENGNVIKINISKESIEELFNICDKRAIEHYREIFQDLKKRGFFVIINLFHWSLPLWINDPRERVPHEGNKLGNCFNQKTVIEFTKYAALIADQFSDLADKYCTMNEPNEVFKSCSEDKSISAFRARMKYFIEAHARAYDVIKAISNKPVGLIYSNGDVQSFDNQDIEIKTVVEFEQRYSFFDALTKGDMSWYVADCKTKGLESGPSKRGDLENRMDWLGVNYYSRNVVMRNENGYESVKGLGYDAGLISRDKSLDGRSVTETGWEIYPIGIYNLLMSYYRRYGLPMIVTENGLADKNDIFRSRYLVSHLHYVEKAISEGANIEGYLHWSLCDNFEWGSGFSKKFGLVMVDYNTKKRYLRPSALVFREIAKNNEIPEQLEWLNQDKF